MSVKKKIFLAAAPAKNGSQSSTARGSPSIAQGQYEGNENPSNAMKKASKIKKRYEKKLLAAEEELQEIREVVFLVSQIIVLRLLNFLSLRISTTKENSYWMR